MEKSKYVTVDDIMEDFECSEAKAYQIMRQLNRQLRKEQPNLIILRGKLNREYYEKYSKFQN